MGEMSRRRAVQRLACGVGGLGLATLLADEARAEPGRPAKAKSLIFLNMMGGPTQFETFDFKPEMAKHDGKDPSHIAGRQEGTVRFVPGSKVAAPAFKYLRGKGSGVATTEVFPHMAGVLDELCVVRSMVAVAPDHPGGQRQAMTGYARQPMPSLGSWLLYGLGSANKDLPGFVYLAEGTHHGSGFLPGATQGMPVGAKIPNLTRPRDVTESAQRGHLDLVGELNRDFASRHAGADALEARVEAAELAFRMQMSCPEAVDLSKESRATLELYGVSDPAGPRGVERGKVRGVPQTNVEFGTMCLVARRLVERGVRVVTICVGGRRGWDQHNNLRDGVAHNAGVTDRAMAALIADLKRSGLLDSTVVMWGGEFGRTPYAQNGDGRDHFARGFTYWLAGGGTKKGSYYGETDDIGQTITKDPVHVHDLHATLLHLMGLDPDKLTFRHGGRDQRLTDTSGKVVPGLIA